MITLPSEFLCAPLAHRALHDVANGRPENSRAAIRAAINAGYGIEIDLQLSRDGRAMVFHDYDLTRLTGTRGAIQQRTSKELADLVLLGGEEGIPTFADVLQLVAGRVPLLVELKDQHGQMGQTTGILERAIAEDLQHYKGPVGLMSFNPHSMVLLAELAPDVPRGIVTCDFPAEDWSLLREPIRNHLRTIPDYDRARACFVSHEVSDLDTPRMAELKAAGAHVFCWTVRSPEQEATARQVADNVTFEGYLAPIPA